MGYPLAILVPPLAVLYANKPFQALLNVALTLLGWIPGLIHALIVVHGFEQAKRRRSERVAKAMLEGRPMDTGVTILPESTPSQPKEPEVVPFPESAPARPTSGSISMST